MQNTISQPVPMAHVETVESALSAHPEVIKDSSPNRLANIWMLILSSILGLTLLCTGVLVAWPVLAWLATKLTDM